jgi:hypothetical protein
MTSPYRPEIANGMTGSSIAHGLAGGVVLPKAVSGFDVHFQKPAEGKPMTMGSKGFPAPTHSYAGGGMGHSVHNPRL